MIYITGDTHIPVDIGKLSTKCFPQQKEMTKNDHVIICGDFGGVWDGSNEEKYWIKWLKNKNFTTLFLDGNHENFDMLYAMPEMEFAGGAVHKVDEGIYHLIRGEAYTINGKKIFVFGGARSHDKDIRTEGKNWWKTEMPSDREYENAERNLEKYNFNFDYVITHCAPTSIQRKLAPTYEINRLTDYFENVKLTISYKKWFFGHYHRDEIVDEKYIAIFNSVSKIDAFQT
ncbi:MAG: metallophosphoesterase [Clostridia bacterium]|nr:metallophosphoesterase [Clostridia bacterium]